MQVQNLVQASADVITITRLQPGDVYKRIHDNYSTPELRFGIVQSVMNNGTDGAVSALEFTPEYGSVKVENKVITTSGDFAIFPASPDEVAEHLTNVEKTLQEAVESAERALRLALDKQERVKGAMRDVALLTAPAVSSVPVDGLRVAAELQP